MRKKKQHINNGFTLIEVFIAMAVLTVGILSLYSMHLSSVRGNARANRLTTASTWNASKIEEMIGMQYSDVSLQDTDGDGAAGLDDATATTADGTDPTDGRYTIYWNVAEDTPIPNLKTIHVIVKDNQQFLSRPVIFTYIKHNII